MNGVTARNFVRQTQQRGHDCRLVKPVVKLEESPLKNLVVNSVKFLAKVGTRVELFIADLPTCTLSDENTLLLQMNMDLQNIFPILF